MNLFLLFEPPVYGRQNQIEQASQNFRFQDLEESCGHRILEVNGKKYFFLFLRKGVDEGLLSWYTLRVDRARAKGSRPKSTQKGWYKMEKKLFMVVDVETAGGFDNPMVYDIGFAICDKKGNVYESFSYIIDEVFSNRKLMDTAYYAIKVPRYLADIANGTRTVVPFSVARDTFNQMIEKYNVGTVCAYNLKFDANALGNTSRKLGVAEKFLTKKVDMLCIWSLACELLYTQKMFRTVAEKQGWVSDKGNLKTSAEIGHRYITCEYDFEEEHTGLEDVLIEVGILAKCFSQHKAHKSGILPNPWRIPNGI